MSAYLWFQWSSYHIYIILQPYFRHDYFSFNYFHGFQARKPWTRGHWYNVDRVLTIPWFPCHDILANSSFCAFIFWSWLVPPMEDILEGGGGGAPYKLFWKSLLLEVHWVEKIHEASFNMWSTLYRPKLQRDIELLKQFSSKIKSMGYGCCHWNTMKTNCKSSFL